MFASSERIVSMFRAIFYSTKFCWYSINHAAYYIIYSRAPGYRPNPFPTVVQQRDGVACQPDESPYGGNLPSCVRTKRPSSISCATSILSNGSLWHTGSRDTACAWAKLTGNSVIPDSRQNLVTCSAVTGISSGFTECLIATSHTDAELM